MLPGTPYIGIGLEEASEFKLSHGQAIAIGMRYEAAVAFEQGIFNSEEVTRLTSAIERIGLPLSIPSDLDIDQAVTFMRNDKKNTDGEIKIAVPKKFGTLFSDGYELVGVPEPRLRKLLEVK